MTTMNSNGQAGEKLTEEMRKELNRRETIAKDDPTSTTTAAGWAARPRVLVRPQEDAPAEGTEPESAETEIQDDGVNHPLHYTQHPSGVECIQIVEHMTFNVGNAVKYCWRSGLKTPDAVTDLKKAIFYLEREVQRLQNQEPES